MFGFLFVYTKVNVRNTNQSTLIKTKFIHKIRFIHLNSQKQTNTYTSKNMTFTQKFKKTRIYKMNKQRFFPHKIKQCFF